MPDQCKRADGTRVDCVDTCRLPWGCPALPCYDAARAEYIKRSRETIGAKLKRPSIAAEIAHMAANPHDYP